MRLICKFKTDKLPISYNIKFVSLIKEALIKYNKDYYEELYIYEGKKSKKSKDFCFSVYIDKPILEGDDIICGDYILLNISSPNNKLLMSFYNAFLKFDNYKDYNLEKVRIDVKNTKRINKNYMVCKTNSPIFIKDKNNKTLDYSDSEYNSCINYISDLILKNYRGYGLLEDLEFYPLELNKVVKKEKISPFTEKTNKEYMYVNANKGIFALKGHPQDLTELLSLGIGYRRNLGYGAIEVIN